MKERRRTDGLRKVCGCGAGRIAWRLRVSGRRWVHGSGGVMAAVTKVLRRPCYHCGLMFEPTRPHQKHCRPSCRLAAFKARADRPLLPRLLEGELFRVPFE